MQHGNNHNPLLLFIKKIIHEVGKLFQRSKANGSVAFCKKQWLFSNQMDGFGQGVPESFAKPSLLLVVPSYSANNIKPGIGEYFGGKTHYIFSNSFSNSSQSNRESGFAAIADSLSSKMALWAVESPSVSGIFTSFTKLKFLMSSRKKASFESCISKVIFMLCAFLLKTKIVGFL